MFFFLYNFPVHCVTVCQNNVVYRPTISYSIFLCWDEYVSMVTLAAPTSNKYTVKYVPNNRALKTWLCCHNTLTWQEGWHPTLLFTFTKNKVAHNDHQQVTHFNKDLLLSLTIVLCLMHICNKQWRYNDNYSFCNLSIR